MRMAQKFVVIGNGIAGMSAVKAIREVDLDTEICLIGEEDCYPYNRIRLSKGMFDEIDENKIQLQKKEWYTDNKIDIRVSEKVVKVDTDHQEVFLYDGYRLKYDQLLLANGARNRTPAIDGIDIKGVYALRSLKDAKVIHKNLYHAKTVTIIGGGIQGLEMAWVLHQHGKKVYMIELQSRLMPLQLDEQASEMLFNIIQSFGIHVFTGSTVNEIFGNNQVEGVRINAKEELICEMVIYATGIKPNLELLKDSNVQTARGILVNNKMKTNIHNIYAAGDIAELNHHIVGLWNIAITQGKIAGYNMTGKEIEYQNITPVTTLNSFGISLFSMGCIEVGKDTKVIAEEDDHRNIYKKLFINNDVIEGAIVMGDTKKSPLIKTMIEKKIKLEEADLAECSIDTMLGKYQN